ncbi:unnamed protein product [Allacma fusca]|uniref:Uncharacterized protein n=1 Tax=Allacma fusca TaxID=39272 RepID=A0A8J2NST4_9HEXA|nr:unnamed protein product [Allacma fusca]
MQKTFTPAAPVNVVTCPTDFAADAILRCYIILRNPHTTFKRSGGVIRVSVELTRTDSPVFVDVRDVLLRDDKDEAVRSAAPTLCKP